MKKFSICVCTILITISCKITLAQSETEMKAWQDYMTPGDIHKMLASSDGTWSEEITMWMDPSQPSTKSTGTVENKMIMGGRYFFKRRIGKMAGRLE